MADVFISYSKQDPEPTEQLAADLEARGYSVWWDTSLLPGDHFPAVIRNELKAARAVIVIWTQSSVDSEWVYAEAQIGKNMGTLITLRTPDVVPDDIPPPFNVTHTEIVTNRQAILAALASRGVDPSFEEADYQGPQHPHEVEIYTTPTCHFSQGAKKFFAANGVAFNEYNVATDIPRRKEMIETSGQMGVPVIRIDGEIVIGFDEGRLRELLDL